MLRPTSKALRSVMVTLRPSAELARSWRRRLRPSTRFWPRVSRVLRITSGLVATKLVGAMALTSRSEEHTSELQSRPHLVCRLLLEKKNKRRLYKRALIFVPNAAYLAWNAPVDYLGVYVVVVLTCALTLRFMLLEFFTD